MSIDIFKLKFYYQWAVLCAVFCFSNTNLLWSQNTVEHPILIQWDESPSVLPTTTIFTPPGTVMPSYLYPNFADAIYGMAYPLVPVYAKQMPLSSPAQMEAVLLQAQYEDITFDYEPNYEETEVKVAVELIYYKGKPLAQYSLIPIRKNPSTGKYQKLVNGRLQIRFQNIAPTPSVQRWNLTTSILSTGTTYKIALTESGVYKLDYNFLRNNLGIDPANIDPRKIQIFGNGGKMLPELLSVPRPEDLVENAIYVQSATGTSFGNNDYILFYAQGTKYWERGSSGSGAAFDHIENYYADTTYYYIKLNENIGRRIQNINNNNNADYITDVYDALAHHERNTINLHHVEQPTLPPAGRRFFGESFKTNASQDFTFNFKHLERNTPVRLTSAIVARSITGSLMYKYVINGTNQTWDVNINRTGSGTYDAYAREGILRTTFNAPSNTITLKITKTPNNSSIDGWLDYITLHARCTLVFDGEQLLFRDLASINSNVTRFNMRSNQSNMQVWDVSDLYNVMRMNGNWQGNQFSFDISTRNSLKEFIAFTPENIKTPQYIGIVAQQNLHAMTRAPKFLIIYHSYFEEAARRLQSHRMNVTNMSTEIVNVAQIYEEFGSGMKDISAIRDFIKMLYNRSTSTDSLHYVLFLGAGSFDYKDIIFKGEANHNFIPLYQTLESIDPNTAYTTDDFFAALDDTDGNILSNTINTLDIAIGRIPAINAQQANTAIDKIIRYETEPQTLGDWQNNISFISDDEDGGTHFAAVKAISDTMRTRYPIYNITSIHADAYTQVSTGGGNRYPDAMEAIIRRITQGSLVMNYIGHGADDGLAQERIFTNTEIRALRNKNKLPLFITATCSFAPHDDPSLTSAGEELLFNAEGGMIALFTTVRVVFANTSNSLVLTTMRKLFEPLDNGNRMPTLGEVITISKNAYLYNSIGNSSIHNTRKFVLIGDPSMTLAYPKHKVRTLTINGEQPNAQTVQIGALQKVTITGEIVKNDGTIATDYNGILYPTVYDKMDTLSLKDNDRGSNGRDLKFHEQSKVIFRGRASVNSGQFRFEFIVPRDINYSLGTGRISYYAGDENTLITASGYDEGFKIGGSYAQAATDNIGPEVKVYMNDESFAFGGLTDANPTLLVKLYDENGINTVGNSIGHDLQGKLTLPQITQTTTGTNGEIKTYKLNEAYQAELDNYQRGTVQYPLNNLKDGIHNIEVEAWDVYNNVGYGSTEFVVASDASSALQRVLNYPNPFTTSTNFLFEHNLPGQEMDIQIQIFTISGKLIKTIRETRAPESYYVRDIHWDGLDEYGDRLARGTYIYKVTVKTVNNNITKTSDYQKLVILK